MLVKLIETKDSALLKLKQEIASTSFRSSDNSSSSGSSSSSSTSSSTSSSSSSSSSSSKDRNERSADRGVGIYLTVFSNLQVEKQTYSSSRVDSKVSADLDLTSSSLSGVSSRSSKGGAADCINININSSSTFSQKTIELQTKLNSLLDVDLSSSADRIKHGSSPINSKLSSGRK